MEIFDLGQLGEEIVCRYLVSAGFRILERNYRISGGEIDIIAENGEYLAFVEVKTRRVNSMTSGYDAVTKNKKYLIIRAAADYCTKNPNELQPRFDIARVMIDDKKYSIDYISNAYDTTGYKFIF